MPSPAASRDEPGRPGEGREALIAFFQTKFGKKADEQLIAFLEKTSNRSNLPATLVKPALSLLGISGDLASLSDVQVLECVERNGRSLMSDLKDFQAGAKQVVADRAKTIITRLVNALQSPSRIRAALASPAPAPVPAPPLAPVVKAPSIPLVSTAASPGRKPRSSVGLVVIAIALAGTAAALVVGFGIAWSTWQGQTAAVPPITSPVSPPAKKEVERTPQRPVGKSAPAADKSKAAPPLVTKTLVPAVESPATAKSKTVEPSVASPQEAAAETPAKSKEPATAAQPRSLADLRKGTLLPT